MGASYNSHRDPEFSVIGRILHEVHIGIFFLGSPFYTTDKEGGALRVDQCMGAKFLNFEGET